MKVLVLGGTGFVGRHAAAALRARGHTVLIGTRNPKRALARLPAALRDCDLRETHLESLTTHYVWKPLLKDVDAVLNAVGILRQRGGETFDRVHHMAPQGLAMACERLGVRLVHVSALGLRRESRNRCLRSKLQGERVIMETGADWSIVRPSLLDGDGGEAAGWLRRAARWPLHPYPSDARGRIAALDVKDLGAALAALCEARNDKSWGEVELGARWRSTWTHYGATRWGTSAAILRCACRYSRRWRAWPPRPATSCTSRRCRPRPSSCCAGTTCRRRTACPPCSAARRRRSGGNRSTRRGPPGTRRPCRPARSSRSGSCRGTAGGSPRRSRTPGRDEFR